MLFVILPSNSNMAKYHPRVNIWKMRRQTILYQRSWLWILSISRFPKVSSFLDNTPTSQFPAIPQSLSTSNNATVLAQQPEEACRSSTLPRNQFYIPPVPISPRNRCFIVQLEDNIRQPDENTDSMPTSLTDLHSSTLLSFRNLFRTLSESSRQSISCSRVIT